MTLLTEVLYFFFSLLLNISAFAVVTAKNAVHAVFFLIFTFSLSAVLLLWLDIEFIALLFVVVYVGAIAVLFLFVVMMLDLRNMVSSNKDESIYLDTSITISFLLLLVLIVHIFEPFIASNSLSHANNIYYVQYPTILDGLTNINIIGEALYTFFSPVFILAGYILLLAMLGSIMLTLQHHIASRKQNSYIQLDRQMEKSVLKFSLNLKA